MSKIKTISIIVLALLASAFLAACGGQPEPVERFVYDSKGYPDQKTVENLFDEMDYQRAVQVYLWAVAPMAIAGQHKMNDHFGAGGNFDFITMYQDGGVKGMLTPNTIVKYCVNFINLKETGPAVIDWPGGMLVGVIMDYDHRYLADVGLTTAAGPNPEKILLVGPGQEVPAGAEGYRIVKSPTYIPFSGFRVLNPEEDIDLEKKVGIYPFSERDNPKPARFVKVDKDAEPYYMAHPKGMAYWEQLNEYIQREPVKEVDRYFYAMLESLGMKKGEPFKPTPRQRKILEKAAFMGEKMAIATSFATRNKATIYRDDAGWVHPFWLNPSHKTEFTEQIDERVDWTFEAYGVSPAMKTKTVGKGSIYLGSYRDKNKNWFDGGKFYKMKVAPDAPMKQFWALTVYNLDTRTIIQNKQGVSELSSRTEGLVKNKDGSIDIYFGPTAPVGHETNWVQTIPNEYWFTYFRLYAPTEAYFDRSWPMYDIEEIK
jgi:hypothetical protein